MMQTYQPPQVDVAQDTPPELQPIFSFLNSHSNKLYQEGYFLKLHDLDSRGRPSPDRIWTECFAQLVGTVLSLWDAAALDLAGEDGEVVPTFINLSDASIKMIESLPMNGAQGGNLQNVLSISTAANNRYLLHFNSLNSLTQWTAGIRLAMFEHATLQEAYTGSLIAGKGRHLNNIKSIMERSKFAHEDWARVRFGAGTPWRRCWCVVSQPDEKDVAKAQKMAKKTSAYEKMRMPRGDINFYDTRKVTKKTRPIATVSDAFAAYAIYPQSKPLIDQSTLVKLEGLVTIHSSPESTAEGFVFVMPEVHAAVSGFEMMLRWLFPVYDTFGLYGRPNRLIADTLDQRGLMFAMPRDRRYGYLDTLDVSGLIHTQGSQNWTDRQWRRELKKLTSARMTSQSDDGSETRSASQRRNTTSRTSMPPTRGGVRFEDGAAVSTHSSPGSRSASPVQMGGAEDPRLQIPRRTDSAPPTAPSMSPHKRSASDAHGYRKYMTETPSRLSYEASRPDDFDYGPPPPMHGGVLGTGFSRSQGPGSLERIQSGAEVPTLGNVYNDVQTQHVAAAAASPTLPPPAPVLSPPAFTHNPSSRPVNQPYTAPELRRAHSNVDAATLYQMQDAVRRDDAPEDAWHDALPEHLGQQYQQSQHAVASTTLPTRSLGLPADHSAGLVSNGMVADRGLQGGDPRQRLSTIQGSPYVGENGEVFQSPEQAYGASGLNGGFDGSMDEERLAATAPSLHATRSSRSIARKPLPQQPLQMPETQARQASDPYSPDSPIGRPSWEGEVIDTSMLEKILNNSPSRNNTMQSDATPDYASTASVSTHESQKKSIERPRAGQLKTVGDPDFQSDKRRSYGTGKLDSWEQDLAAENAEVPNIDFGPTLTYKPTSRPGTSGTMTPGKMHDRSRSRSGDRLRDKSTERLSGTVLANSQRPSPVEANRQSYFGGRNTPSPNPGIQTAAGAEHMGTPGDRTSMAWQPGFAVAGSPGAGQPSKQSLTPEQWVQYKAALAAQPQQPPLRRPTPNYAHQRTASGHSITQLRRSLTKTPPPLSRTPSGDWTQQQTPQRTPPSRPQSRGANTYFAQPSPGAGGGMSTQPTNLSAREQMHVARATGTPFINQTNSAQKQQAEEQTPGLFGALAARQREKEESKNRGGRGGAGNPIVQQAIASRQQQQYQQEAEVGYQMQMQQQAMFQQQASQVQAQLQAQSLMLAQQQSQGGSVMGFGAQQQQQGGMQRANSWQLAGNAGGMQQPPAGGFSSQFAQRQWEGQQAAVRAQQQQQQQGGGQQQWHQPRR